MMRSEILHTGTRSQIPSERELAHKKLARELAKEAIVLLKNENFLPLNVGSRLALFGNGAEQTIKGGTGSGDVNNRENISIYQGLCEAGFVITSERWIHEYRDNYKKAREEWRDRVWKSLEEMKNPFQAYTSNPFYAPDGREIEPEDYQGADAIIYVVSRISGEGHDRSLEAGDYYLSEKEERDLALLGGTGLPIVLILNTGGPVELTGILEREPGIRALLFMSQLGQEAGAAVADVLSGVVSPCGKLTASWARDYYDYPCAETFGKLNGDLSEDVYGEETLVGYRYLKDPLFPFGFGLSYTDFQMELVEADVVTDPSMMKFCVRVENRGKEYAGKEVVEIYARMPQTGRRKEELRLVGFAKTRSLEPMGSDTLGTMGADNQEESMVSDTLEVLVPQKNLAVFSEKEHAWVVEKGIYQILIGNSSKHFMDSVALKVAEDVVIEKTFVLENDYKEEAYPEVEMDCGAVSAEAVPAEEMLAGVAMGEAGLMSRVVLEYHPVAVKTAEQKTEAAAKQDSVVKSDMKLKMDSETEAGVKGKASIKEAPSSFVSKLDEIPTDKLLPLLYGNVTDKNSMLGSAGKAVPGAAGETTGALFRDYQIPSVLMADGPAGLRLIQSYEVDKENGELREMDLFRALECGYLIMNGPAEESDIYYQYCTAFPVGTAVAQTWNEELLRRFGQAVGREMNEFHIRLWLAPGMNIQRNPLCGRNFEYFSEDPILTGKTAAAITQGVQSVSQCGVTLKHFACNNQEDNRLSVDAKISERAFREVYLRAFEIAVKEASPKAIMTSYNKINGIHAANHIDLCTHIARDEWGFEGIIMTDWSTTFFEDGSIPWRCAWAGNDLIMPGNVLDAKDIREAFKDGRLSEETLRACAGRMLRLLDDLA